MARCSHPRSAEGDLGRHYVESLADRTETLTSIITQLAGVGNVPAVFHCTAGKDRTGMVAALVLSLVGVDDEVIVEDYTLTDERMVLVMERIRAEGDFPEPLAPVAASVARAEASSMETFLAALGSQPRWRPRLGPCSRARRRRPRRVARGPRRGAAGLTTARCRQFTHRADGRRPTFTCAVYGHHGLLEVEG